MKSWLLSLLFLLISSVTFAQKVDRFGFAYRSGWLVKHHDELATSFSDAKPRAFEFTYLVKTNGTKEWQRAWGFPDIGFNIAYMGYNDSRLGRSWIATMFLQKYFGPEKAPNLFSFKLAPGLSFSNKKYDETTNPDNTFISTTINGTMEGNFLMHMWLGEKLDIFGGIVFTHYSNGGIKAPNSGFNVPAFTVGATYTPNPDRWKPVTTPLPAFKRHVRYQAMVAPAVKTISEEDDKLYFAWTGSAYASFQRSYKSAWTAGIDLFYNTAIPARTGNPEAKKYRVGIHLGHDLIAGRNSILFQYGYYIYRPEDVDTSHYWRIGLKHHVSDHVFLGAFLKAHLGKADVIEWSLGYRI